MNPSATHPLPDDGETSPPWRGAAGNHLLDTSMFWTIQGGGGVHRYLQAKRHLMTRIGWRHTLMAPGANGADQLDCGGLPIPGSSGYRFVVQRRHAARMIERIAPDLIESADPYALGWASLDAAARLGVPSVAFCHSNLPTLMATVLGGRGARPRLGRWARRQATDYLTRLYGRFDMVLAPSRSMVQELRAMGLSQAIHQPLGVDCTVFTPEAGDPVWRRSLLARLGLSGDARLLLYVGRFAPEKNLQVLVDAVQRLGPPHALLLVGDGPVKPQGACVRRLPNEPDSACLARLMASVDVFVHAGDQETFGLSALEAMACGTPVVVSAEGGLGELADGVGLRVQGLGASSWTQAMQAALQRSRPLPVQAALQRARAHDWDTLLGQLMRRYHRLLDSADATQRLPRAAPRLLYP